MVFVSKSRDSTKNLYTIDSVYLLYESNSFLYIKKNYENSDEDCCKINIDAVVLIKSKIPH